MATVTGRRRRRCWPVAVCAVVAAGVVGLSAFGAGQEAEAPVPEYARVVNAKGLLGQEQINGTSRTTFRTQDGKWSAVLLPSRMVAQLEDEVAGLRRPRVITLTGVVTAYRGRNYLLVKEARVGAPVGPG